MRVVGLDLSLTSTGFALIEPGQVPRTQAFRSTGKETDDLHSRWSRLTGLSHKIMTATWDSHPDLVVVEMPAFSRVGGSNHDRSGLWWMVVSKLHSLGAPVLEVTSTALKKYATGSGAASKDAVVIAVTRRYPEVVFKVNDEADALVLAAIGCRLLGAPIEESLPKAHLEVMTKINLPKEFSLAS